MRSTARVSELAMPLPTRPTERRHVLASSTLRRRHHQLTALSGGVLEEQELKTLVHPTDRSDVDPVEVKVPSGK